jgi:hypothetical protein
VLKGLNFTVHCPKVPLQGSSGEPILGLRNSAPRPSLRGYKLKYKSCAEVKDE